LVERSKSVYQHALETFEKYTDLLRSTKRRQDQPLDPDELQKELRLFYAEQMKLARLTEDVTAEARILKHAVDLEPGNVSTRKMLITTLQKMGDMHSVAAQIRAMTEYAPKDPHTWYNLALVEASNGRDATVVLDVVRKAAILGGPDVLERIRKERLFESYREDPAFREFLDSIPVLSATDEL